MSSLSPTPELLPIGVVARPHGVRGMLRVHPYDPDSRAFLDLERLFVGTLAAVRPDPKGHAIALAAAAPREYAITSVTFERDAWLVKLEGVNDRDAADALRGREVYAFRDELPAPSDDEVYIADLIGCSVVDVDGRALGTVREVHDFGAGELLVVDLVPGIAVRAKEALIPFVEPILVSVDIEARVIVCDPPEGLLDPESIA